MVSGGTGQSPTKWGNFLRFPSIRISWLPSAFPAAASKQRMLLHCCIPLPGSKRGSGVVCLAPAHGRHRISLESAGLSGTKESFCSLGSRVACQAGLTPLCQICYLETGIQTQVQMFAYCVARSFPRMHFSMAFYSF